MEQAWRWFGPEDVIHLPLVRQAGVTGSFMEPDHLGGDVDMVSVVTTLLEDGHELLDDVGKATHPGYPAIGRLRGLAEIRGIMTAGASLRQLPV
jgi:mannonate dehydratase